MVVATRSSTPGWSRWPACVPLVSGDADGWYRVHHLWEDGSRADLPRRRTGRDHDGGRSSCSSAVRRRCAPGGARCAGATPPPSKRPLSMPRPRHRRRAAGRHRGAVARGDAPEAVRDSPDLRLLGSPSATPATTTTCASTASSTSRDRRVRVGRRQRRGGRRPRPRRWPSPTSAVTSPGCSPSTSGRERLPGADDVPVLRFLRGAMRATTASLEGDPHAAVAAIEAISLGDGSAPISELVRPPARQHAVPVRAGRRGGADRRADARLAEPVRSHAPPQGALAGGRPGGLSRGPLRRRRAAGNQRALSPLPRLLRDGRRHLVRRPRRRSRRCGALRRAAAADRRP